MPPDYSIVDIWPTEWRRLASPVGAIWLVALGVSVVGREWWVHPTQGLGWPVLVGAVLLAVLAWLTIGFVALSLAWAIEKVWLARWPRLGALIVRWRRRRWANYHRDALQAVAAGDLATAHRRARQRNDIAVAEPRCPFWMADRWASLEHRVEAAYGLDAAAVWPRLWLTLPEQVRSELRDAAAVWHRACVWASWAVLFTGLAVVAGYAGRTALWWPAGVMGVMLAAWAWRRGRAAIGYRAELIEATFDTHGVGLAAALAVRLEPGGRLDPRAGEEITARIRKGA